MAGRKRKADTYSTEGEMLRAKPPQPPAHVYLREIDMPYWDTIIRARAFDAWIDSDLEHAANLARCKSDIDRLSREIEVEGDTVINQRGTPIVNPKHSLLETLSRRSVALSRLLHVHPQATEGDSGDQRKRNTKQREMLKKREELAQDDFIAPPMH